MEDESEVVKGPKKRHVVEDTESEKEVFNDFDDDDEVSEMSDKK